ncbi:MAG: Holliday junction branch migration protein RuvA [Rhodobacterales bacterium]|nr:MAG: Holliday junction branch migration protein RuvA [Rhodobacterales bacterium]
MIGKITGIMDYRAEDHVLIDVRGVGYLVHCSERTMAALPGKGEVVALYTDMIVREDLMQLFGFPSLLEKEWFRLLTSVQGIGAKAAMAILGALGAEAVNRAIALGDWNSIKAAKGVGPKTAQRVVNELKDKAPAVMAMGGALAETLEMSAGAGADGPSGGAPASDDVSDAPSRAPAQSGRAQGSGGAAAAQAQAEALSALANLGYGPGEAASAVAEAAGTDPGADTPVLIRAALKLLAPKG